VPAAAVRFGDKRDSNDSVRRAVVNATIYAQSVRKGVFSAIPMPDSALGTNIPKNENKSKALQRAKMLSSHRILGPAHVLAVEVFGRSWQPAISGGGVAIEVGRLRCRALMSP
jgi:hypothetical protein